MLRKTIKMLRVRALAAGVLAAGAQARGIRGGVAGGHSFAGAHFGGAHFRGAPSPVAIAATGGAASSPSSQLGSYFSASSATSPWLQIRTSFRPGG